MKRILLVLLATVVVFGMLAGPNAPPAKAIQPFMNAFHDLYLKRDSKDPKDKAYVTLVQTAKCNLCHQGKTKKERNVYGTALDDLLDRKTDKDDKEKVRKALITAAEKHSDPAKPDSPTFGQLIGQGKLPGGDPKPASTASAGN